MILLSQVLNGVLLPIILILILRLVNRRDLMGEYVNSKFDNLMAYGTVVVMIGLSLTLVALTLWTSKAV